VARSRVMTAPAASSAGGVNFSECGGPAASWCESINQRPVGRQEFGGWFAPAPSDVWMLHPRKPPMCPNGCTP